MSADASSGEVPPGVSTMSVQDVAHALGVSRQAVLDHLIANGALPHLRVGRRILVLREHFERYVAAERQRDRKCHACEGKGWYPCASCQGSGEHVCACGDRHECRYCSGSTRRRCLVCQGSGTQADRIAEGRKPA